ncbi:MAG TPA: hypothetical protein VJG65_01770 [Patescibacteria group bacterium]|nr:hypothetical protein [Patescibacteria group bacterium]
MPFLTKKTLIFSVFGLAALILILCSSALIPAINTPHCLATDTMPGSHFQLLSNIQGIILSPSELLFVLFIVGALALNLNISFLPFLINEAIIIFHQIRQWFGSFRQFFYLTTIFSQGILNPKTF